MAACAKPANLERPVVVVVVALDASLVAALLAGGGLDDPLVSHGVVKGVDCCALLGVALDVGDTPAGAGLPIAMSSP